jgi:hypothetical protein
VIQYVVIGNPPSLAGALNGTSISVPDPETLVGVPIVGVPGTVAAIIAALAALLAPFPTTLVAYTTNV